MTNSTESRIAAILWRWKFADVKDRDGLISESNLATLIEFWFPFSDIEVTQKLGLWCDGIPQLQIEELGRKSFRIIGVGYFPYQQAAFELDFNFEKRRDAIPKSIVVRLGQVGHEQRQSSARVKHPQHLIDSRPSTNSQWMVAVELSEAQTQISRDENSN